MGTGKSTLGEALGRAAACGTLKSLPRGVRYVDLDTLVESRAGMSIPEIFATRGEQAFRRMESETLRMAVSGGDVIVGCGGGTPCHSGNMEWMLSRGMVVCLEASHPVLLRRLLEAQSKRPLLHGLTPAQVSEFIAERLAVRSRWYGMAHLIFPSDELEDEVQIARSVERFDSLLLSEDFSGLPDVCKPNH
jgi:shikimate kinase